MKECKHKWKVFSQEADGCGCCGIIDAVCVNCEDTIHEYLSFWQLGDLDIIEEGEREND